MMMMMLNTAYMNSIIVLHPRCLKYISTHTLCVQNVDLLDVTAGGTHSCHCALKG